MVLLLSHCKFGLMIDQETNNNNAVLASTYECIPLSRSLPPKGDSTWSLGGSNEPPELNQKKKKNLL